MEKTKKKKQRIPNTSKSEIISLLISNNVLKKTEIKTIEMTEILDKFPLSTAAQIYTNHKISFVRCLKAFLQNHFKGDVDPLYEPDSIDGLTPKEIIHIEELCRKKN